MINSRHSTRYPWLRRRSPADEAAYWYVALQSPKPSPQMVKRWQKWIAVPANKEAFDRADADWRLIGEAERPAWPTDAEVAADVYDGSPSIEEYQRRGKARAWRAQPAWISLAAAVILAIGLVITVSVLIDANDHHGAGMIVFQTPVAQHEEVVLPDGSHIQMGASTAVTTNVTRSVRYIVVDRGEASFKVAHDSRRPFRVLAGGGIITAVGTEFNVRRLDGLVVVTVTEGIVEVAPASALTARDGGDFPAGTRVAKGQEVSYDLQGRLGEVRKADLTMALSWRAGRLQFASEPLSQVVQDVNRYSDRTIVIADEAARQQLYSGTVFARDIDDWLAALDKVFPELQVSKPDDKNVMIRTRGLE